MNITVMSRAELAEYYMSVKVPTAVISITERDGKNLPLEGNANIKDVLYLHFDDEVEGNNAIKEEQARLIYKFVEEHFVLKKNCEDLIVQCFAGVSRSAGVAAAISLAIKGDDSEIFNNGRYVPNMLCYRKVLDAFGFHLGYEEVEEKEKVNLDAWKKNQDL